MSHTRILSAAVASAILLGGTGGALAARDSDMTHQYEAWLNSVTTDEAVQIAEQATGDPAQQVMFDQDEYGSAVYRVETRSLDQVSEVEIDAETGSVLEVTSIGPGPAQESPSDPYNAQTFPPSPSDNP